MAKIDAQTYLKNASEAVLSALSPSASNADRYVMILQELRAHEIELKEQAKSLREAIDLVATDALTDGLDFSTVGEALGVSKQAAHMRYAKDEGGRSLKAAEFLRRVMVNNQ